MTKSGMICGLFIPIHILIIEHFFWWMFEIRELSKFGMSKRSERLICKSFWFLLLRCDTVLRNTVSRAHRGWLHWHAWTCVLPATPPGESARRGRLCPLETGSRDATAYPQMPGQLSSHHDGKMQQHFHPLSFLVRILSGEPPESMRRSAFL